MGKRSKGTEGLQNSIRKRIGKGAQRQIVELVKGLPILTIGETPGFAERAA